MNFTNSHGSFPSFVRRGGVLAGMVSLLLAIPAHADKSLDQLPGLSSPAGSDLYYCAQGSVDYRCTLEQIRGWNSVAITGGAIDGAAIGANNPSAGKFLSLNSTGNTLLGVSGTATHPLEVRLDGAGFQTIAAFENQQAAAAGVGPQIMFEGASNTDMASIQSGWNGTANTDAYLSWNTRSGGAMGERMRLTSAGNLGVGATPVNKLDVEGGAVVGATYSGASTAPANGLIIEGSVGIGTASPASTNKLQVTTVAAAASTLAISATVNSGNYNDARGASIAAIDTSSAAGAYSTTGVSINASSTAGRTHNNTGIQQGINGGVYYSGDGTLSTQSGININYGTSNGAGDSLGAVTNSYGVNIGGVKTASSTITNGYGLRITNTQGSALSYDVYAGTSTADNYFAGDVGIGTASPTEKLDVNSNNIRIRTAKTPATQTEACDQGEISWDADYIYVCTATNYWERTAIAPW